MPLLSIAENIFLGNENRHERRHRLAGDLQPHAGNCSPRSACSESPNTLITDIGVGKQQLVEIAKALSKSVKLLILDEPTASLNESDSDALLNLLMEFRKQGMTSIIISHKLNEIRKVADQITVLRDGRRSKTLDCHTDEISEDRHHQAWSAAILEDRYPPRSVPIGETHARSQELERLPPAAPRPAGPARHQCQRPQGRSRRHRRPDGRRPHRDSP